MSTEEIAQELIQERHRQIEAGWTPEHDVEHGVVHLANEVVWRASKLHLHEDGYLVSTPPDREEWVAIGALAIAAIEVLDKAD